jgi:hypothetical protein
VLPKNAEIGDRGRDRAGYEQLDEPERRLGADSDDDGLILFGPNSGHRTRGLRRHRPSRSRGRLQDGHGKRRRQWHRQLRLRRHGLATSALCGVHDREERQKLGNVAQPLPAFVVVR